MLIFERKHISSIINVVFGLDKDGVFSVDFVVGEFSSDWDLFDGEILVIDLAGVEVEALSHGSLVGGSGLSISGESAEVGRDSDAVGSESLSIDALFSAHEDLRDDLELCFGESLLKELHLGVGDLLGFFGVMDGIERGCCCCAGVADECLFEVFIGLGDGFVDEVLVIFFLGGVFDFADADVGDDWCTEWVVGVDGGDDDCVYDF